MEQEESVAVSSWIKKEIQEDVNSDNTSQNEQEEKTTDATSADAVCETKNSVDPSLFESIVSMGIDKRLAAKALVCTSNKNVEAALSWIKYVQLLMSWHKKFSLGGALIEILKDLKCWKYDTVMYCLWGLPHSDGSVESDEWEDCEEEDDEDTYYKMVFVVNTELGMGFGKVAAQVGHAALGLYRLLKEDGEKYDASVEEWEEFGERKIALKGKNSQELIELQKKAESLYLPTYLVHDAGKTQGSMQGSTTVPWLILAMKEAVNEVTGKLKLL
nr:peptidyl-tRNA hydrolase 2, mitochondrial-like [Cherax quadricarinatus]